jgi:hypothetical protein
MRLTSGAASGELSGEMLFELIIRCRRLERYSGWDGAGRLR